MWQPRWKGSLGEDGYMYMHVWVPLLFTWNCDNIVIWLYPNTKQKVKINKENQKKKFTFLSRLFFPFKNIPSYFLEMSSGYSLCKWHHSTRQGVSGPHAVLFPGWPSLRCLLVLGLWVSPSDPIATFTDVICPSYYCWITHHPKLSGVKWHFIILTNTMN